MTPIDCFLSRPRSRIPAVECGNWKVMSREACPLLFLYALPFPFSHFLCSHSLPLHLVSPSNLPSSLQNWRCFSSSSASDARCGVSQKELPASLPGSISYKLSSRGALDLLLGVPYVIYELTSLMGSYPFGHRTEIYKRGIQGSALKILLLGD